MPNGPNRLSQFWQELKRRKVIKVITMYAATAFIIMEAGEIMLPRLGMPDWTVTFIIFLLIVGFPIAIILSWIFDVTPEGIKKTEPVEVSREKEIDVKPAKRRLQASDVIIAVLLVIVGILVYPKIFKKDKFVSLRDKDGRISVAVMPFQNMTNDTLWDVWQGGIQNELITNLSNSKELSVRQYQTMYSIIQSTEHTNYASITPTVASNLSRKLEANTFIHGSIKSAGEKIRINVQLIDAGTEEIYKTFQIDGDSEEAILAIADSLSSLIRNYLEIIVLQQEVDPIIHKYVATDSPEAYRYYIQGWNLFLKPDWSTAIEFLDKALETDPDFINARVLKTWAFVNLELHDIAMPLIYELFEQLDQLPYYYQILVKYLKSDYDKDPYEGIKNIELLMEEYPQSYLWQQGYNYWRIGQYKNAIQYFENSLEVSKQWGGLSKWLFSYIHLGISYHEIDDHKRENEIYELGLSILYDEPLIIYRQAICALSQGDIKEANDLIEKFNLIREKEGWKVDRINHWIGTIYQQAKQYDKAIEIFTDIVAENPERSGSKWQLGYILIDNEIDVEEGIKLIDQALRIKSDNTKERIEQTLRINPDSADLLYAKGFGYYKQGKLGEAHEITKKAWDLRPRYYHEHYLLLQEIEQALVTQNQ